MNQMILVIIQVYGVGRIGKVPCGEKMLCDVKFLNCLDTVKTVLP